MAILSDVNFVIYSLTGGTTTSRPYLRRIVGPYGTAGEDDARPVHGRTYDSATEGWIALATFPSASFVNPTSEAAIRQQANYLVNPTVPNNGTAVNGVAATTSEATLATRQAAVLELLRMRSESLAWTQELAAKITPTSRNAAAAVMQAIAVAEVTYAADFGTNPEALLSKAPLVVPALTPAAVDNANVIAEYMGNTTILRPKLQNRATYDYIQAIALGTFNAPGVYLQATTLDLGLLSRGNVWIYTAALEWRNCDPGNKTTVRIQVRSAQLGGALGAWADQLVLDGNAYADINWRVGGVSVPFGEFYDDLEFQVTYTSQFAVAAGVLRNVYLTATRLSVWEAV